MKEKEYTGINDSKNQPINEGAIVVSKQGTKFVVEWHQQHGWCLIQANKGSHPGLQGEWFLLEAWMQPNLEVIGSIYDNAGLLKSDNQPARIHYEGKVQGYLKQLHANEISIGKFTELLNEDALNSELVDHLTKKLEGQEAAHKLELKIMGDKHQEANAKIEDEEKRADEMQNLAFKYQTQYDELKAQMESQRENHLMLIDSQDKHIQKLKAQLEQRIGKPMPVVLWLKEQDPEFTMFTASNKTYPLVEWMNKIEEYAQYCLSFVSKEPSENK